MSEDSQRSSPKLVRGLGLLDATMIVVGSMIGSGIFHVCRVCPAGWLARMAAGGLGPGRPAHHHRRALLRRAGSNVAARGRSVCFPARSL